MDSVDEISLAGKTHVAEFKNGAVTEYMLTPEDVGITSASLVGLDVADAQASLALIRDALGKRTSAEAKKAADMIAINAGAAIYVAGVAQSLKDGVRMAEDLVHNGEAKERMVELMEFTDLLKRKEDEQQEEPAQQ